MHRGLYSFVGAICLACSQAGTDPTVIARPLSESAILRMSHDTLLFALPVAISNRTSDSLFFACEPQLIRLKGEVYTGWGGGDLDPCSRGRLRVLLPAEELIDTALVAIGRGDVATMALRALDVPDRFVLSYTIYSDSTDAAKGSGGSGAGVVRSTPFVLARAAT